MPHADFPKPEEVEDYIQDNYGSCVIGPLDCYKRGCLGRYWLGRRCRNWRPVKATTWEELRHEQQALSRSNNSSD